MYFVAVLSIKYNEYMATITYRFPQTNLPFLMVETSAYFEAYRHVLEGLQEVQGDELPFQRLNISFIFHQQKITCTDIAGYNICMSVSIYI